MIAIIYLDLADVVVEVMDSNNTRACIYIYILHEIRRYQQKWKKCVEEKNNVVVDNLF